MDSIKVGFVFILFFICIINNVLIEPEKVTNFLGNKEPNAIIKQVNSNVESDEQAGLYIDLLAFIVFNIDFNDEITFIKYELNLRG